MIKIVEKLSEDEVRIDCVIESEKDKIIFRFESGELYMIVEVNAKYVFRSITTGGTLGYSANSFDELIKQYSNNPGYQLYILNKVEDLRKFLIK